MKAVVTNPRATRAAIVILLWLGTISTSIAVSGCDYFFDPYLASAPEDRDLAEKLIEDIRSGNDDAIIREAIPTVHDDLRRYLPGMRERLSGGEEVEVELVSVEERRENHPLDESVYGRVVFLTYHVRGNSKVGSILVGIFRVEGIPPVTDVIVDTVVTPDTRGPGE
jgi:hypothetical protein